MTYLNNALRALALGAIRCYQVGISPIIGPACRFHPSCSAYAAEAVVKHGVWRGVWMTVLRLSRCHPWGGSGFDPVPDSERYDNHDKGCKLCK